MHLGGRSPNDATHILFGVVHSDIVWRKNRAALFLRLANAPAKSWQHLTFMAHQHLQTPWYTAASADLALVLPQVRCKPTFANSEPFLSSSGRWSDEGEWVSYHAYALPYNLSGCRYRPEHSWLNPRLSRAVKLHTKRICQLLQTMLTREMWSSTYNRVMDSATANGSSKVILLAARMQTPGPPLHLALDMLEIPHHKDAFTSLLCGDWFLGRYAHNYFAPQLLPRMPQHRNQLEAFDENCSTVCLACWHFRREVYLENEQHILATCPEYMRARQQLAAALNREVATHQDALEILVDSDKEHFQATARYLAQARQIRRRNKAIFESYQQQLTSKSFAAKRIAWRLKGKHACRHGVLFTRAPPSGCKCMATSSEAADWELACYMPALDHRLKCLVAVPFNLPTFARLGTLQSKCRQLGW